MVYRDVLFDTDAMELKIEPGGVLIILGDFTLKNKVDRSNGGILVVQGMLTVNGSQGDFSGSGGVYAGDYANGAQTDNFFPDAIQLDIDPDLYNDPALQYIEDFLNSTCQIPLPIELLFFKAIQSGEKVALSWATASELNFDYFSVERSVDGMEFTEMEQIKGHGTTNERNDYGLDDNSPIIGKNYYRLKSVDFDGYTEYFNVVVVNFSGEKTFSIAPNPTDGTILTFWTNFVPDANSSVTIFDNFSSVIGKYKPTDFNQPIGFATPLKSGLYFAKIVSKDFVRVERFIVH